MTQEFINRTTPGNELAIKRGVMVPDGAINLAYWKSPKLTPQNNVVVIDTSRIAAQNVTDSEPTRQIMYADSMGILQDIHGNQLVRDDRPIVTDVFSVNQNPSLTPGFDYTPNEILPYVHISRFFHVDFSGLTVGTGPDDYVSTHIKVVDARGNLYLDDQGNPRFRIRITPALNALSGSTSEYAYRVYAYVDVDTNESLYLIYNKVEIDVSGVFKNRELYWKELLNPKPFFDYRVESAEVVDIYNRNQEWFSTESLNTVDTLLGLPNVNQVNGYRVYVPRKAILDTRMFQLFRWRVTCTFTQDFQVQDETQHITTATQTTTGPQTEEVIATIPNGQKINCGVVVTNQDPTSYAPYALFNLSLSNYNRIKAVFQNPLGSTSTSRSQASYWYVNFDSISNSDLAKFDFLIWAPSKQVFDFSPYLSKIRYFTEHLGGTLFIDGNNYTVLKNINVSTSSPVTGKSGTVTMSAGNSFTSSLSMNSTSITVDDPTIPLVHGGNFSGFEIELNASALGTLSYLQWFYNPGHCEYIGDVGSYSPVLSCVRSDGFGEEVGTVYKEFGQSGVSDGAGYYKHGKIIVSSLGHLATCSMYFDSQGHFINQNQSPSVYLNPAGGNNTPYVNSSYLAGAMKLLFNACMLAVQYKTIKTLTLTTTRPVITSDLVTKGVLEEYASSWTFASNWQSSWAIDASVLTDLERSLYQFSFLPEDPNNPVPIWQRKLSNQTVDELLQDALTPDMRDRIKGAVRNYVIEVTNSNVSVPTTLGPTSLPYAWTTAYSPSFQIPPNMGPYVIRETEVPAQYAEGQYTYREYPNKPYNVQCRAVYDVNDQFITSDTVHWRATGTATETITITTTVPPRTTTNTSEVSLTWANAGFVHMLTETILRPEYGVVVPTAVKTWAEDNYYASAWGPGQQCWPYWGQNGQFFQGTSGPQVAIIQSTLNYFGSVSFFPLPYGYLVVDGQYGSKTAATVLSFQRTFGARYLDGVVDAETWSLIGAQLLRVQTPDPAYFSIYTMIQRQNISDGNEGNVYAKRSWMRKGPSVVWDTFAVSFNQNYNLHSVIVTPFAIGPPVVIDTLDVFATNGEPFLGGYDPSHSMYTGMPYRVGDGQPLRLDFPNRFANTVTVGLLQDTPFVEESRMIGIRDISALAEVTSSTVIPGYTIVTKQTNTYNLVDTGTAKVTTGHDVVITPQVHYSGPGVLSNIRWSTAVATPPYSNATVQLVNGKIILRNSQIVTIGEEGVVLGPYLPTDITYYSKNQHGRVNLRPESGWISKADGLKLLCDRSGNPVGFPSLPTGSSIDDAARHYTTFSLTAYGLESTVMCSFYDVNTQEFITNANGQPVMPFIDYMQRGPHNIYIGVISTFELDTKLPIPVSSDHPVLPHLAAYPVYGLVHEPRSTITLEPLPPNLGQEDLWPVPIRIGQFDQGIAIPTRVQVPLTTYLSQYQGTTVTAHYSIPEAQIGGFSILYGYPFSDVVDETPIILDDNLLQVRQPPIAVMRDPSVSPGPADPWRPVLQVQHRDSLSSPWVTLSYEDLADWNLSTGEIYLKRSMSLEDPWLWQVSYTSEQRNYYVKRTEEGILNLNPYPGNQANLIDKPIYIYIVPEYVKDAQGNLIADSLVDHTVHFATSSDIFDPVKPNYDPLALQLGTIYISTSINVKDLSMFDTRRRGGGAKDANAISEILRVVKDASTYWDAGYAAGMSYQQGGFVIIRLPSQLKNDFTDQELVDVIERNITAGVRYKVEDLQGNDWLMV